MVVFHPSQARYFFREKRFQTCHAFIEKRCNFHGDNRHFAKNLNLSYYRYGLLTLGDFIDFTANPGAMEKHHRAVKPRLGAIAAHLDLGGQFESRRLTLEALRLSLAPWGLTLESLRLVIELWRSPRVSVPFSSEAYLGPMEAHPRAVAVHPGIVESWRITIEL
jgi:hypothetical protein